MDVIGIDFGYGFTKAIASSRRTIVPSVVGQAQPIRFESSGLGASAPMAVRLENRSFFVGDYALQQSPSLMHTLSPERTGSLEELALFYAVITEILSPGHHEVQIVTGLPIGEYNRDNRGRLHQMLLGEHDITRPKHQDRLVSVKSVYSIPQPMGTFYSLLLDEKGIIFDEKLAQGRVGVVDIGTYTVNFVLIEGSRYVETGSDSITYGTHRAFDVIAKQVRDQFGTDFGNDLFKIETLVQEGGLKRYGVLVEIEGLSLPLEALFEGIFSKMMTLWGDCSQLDCLIVAGGGASLLQGYFNAAVPHACIPSNPQLSNVIGYQRIGIRRWRRN